jgi:hypothetical protein
MSCPNENNLVIGTILTYRPFDMNTTLKGVIKSKIIMRHSVYYDIVWLNGVTATWSYDGIVQFMEVIDDS